MSDEHKTFEVPDTQSTVRDIGHPDEISTDREDESNA